MTSDALLSRLAATRARYEGRAAQRKHVRATVERRGVLHTDTPHRVTHRLNRLGIDWQLAAAVEGGASALRSGPRELDLDRLLGRNGVVDTGFLDCGLAAARAVGRVRVAGRCATGVLVSPVLLLTTNTALPSVTDAARAEVEFDDVATGLCPERFFVTDLVLDFTVVAVREGTLPPHLRLVEHEGKAILGERLTSVRFPADGPKQFGLREHVLVDVLDNYVHYEPGSEVSGGPIFNDQWEVVALHHSGVASGSAWTAGEGVRISRVLRSLRERPLTGEAAHLRAQVFDTAGPVVPEADSELRAALVNLDIGRTRVYYDPVADRNARDRYYAGVRPTREALHQLLTTTHVRRPAYRPCRMLYPWVDLHPDLKLRSLHSGAALDPAELIRADVESEAARSRRFRDLAAAGLPDPGTLLAEFDVLEQALPFNCEHAVPQTSFDRREPMRGDLHHQFTREVGDTPDDPWDRSGPVARAVLYFLVRYPGVVDDALVPDLIMCHERDPVTDHEQHRNAAIAEIQGNRNPFIDHPGWALDI
ncbi:endonuclease [Saccharothrix variisporea]|uniref:Endonuclease I n=1 Tax=Saccharothrix variisporea TaxID=543527 RepID=A0A495XG76_9PSEU|nr:endonuclease [Saccharothrix variisporea]RKT73290.1 endonuclease I [Saccharothrix variisporea]